MTAKSDKPDKKLTCPDCGKERFVRPFVKTPESGILRCRPCSAAYVGKTQNVRHGYHGTAIYNVWGKMVSRCQRENSTDWKHYGGRGISVCDEWRHHPDSFCRWASLTGYKKGLMLDRIDNDKGYSPENCRWVTMLESNRNKRTVYLDVDKAEEIKLRSLSGQRGCDIADAMGIPRTAVYSVLEGRAWKDASMQERR